MIDEDGNEILDDGKITIETQLKTSKYDYQTYVDLASLGMIVAELYEKGIDMGWETKILDPFTDELRKINNLP